MSWFLIRGDSLLPTEIAEGAASPMPLASTRYREANVQRWLERSAEQVVDAGPVFVVNADIERLLPGGNRIDVLGLDAEGRAIIIVMKPADLKGEGAVEEFQARCDRYLEYVEQLRHAELSAILHDYLAIVRPKLAKRPLADLHAEYFQLAEPLREAAFNASRSIVLVEEEPAATIAPVAETLAKRKQTVRAVRYTLAQNDAGRDVLQWKELPLAAPVAPAGPQGKQSAQAIDELMAGLRAILTREFPTVEHEQRAKFDRYSTDKTSFATVRPHDQGLAIEVREVSPVVAPSLPTTTFDIYRPADLDTAFKRIEDSYKLVRVHNQIKGSDMFRRWVDEQPEPREELHRAVGGKIREYMGQLSMETEYKAKDERGKLAVERIKSRRPERTTQVFTCYPISGHDEIAISFAKKRLPMDPDELFRKAMRFFTFADQGNDLVALITTDNVARLDELFKAIMVLFWRL